LSRYYFWVASALVRSASRSALTLARAFSEIPTFSSHAMSASSLHMSSSSHARGNSCNSSTTVVGGIIVVGLGGGGGGRGMHKANTDKSTMHQETSSAAVRSGRSPTFSQHAPSGRSPSSSSDEVAATRCRGWNPHPGDVSRGSHHEPSPYQECLSNEKGKGKKGIVVPAWRRL
jgi:hypothetical protein